MELFGNKKRKRPEQSGGKKRSRAGRRLLTVLIVIVAVVLAVVIGYSIWEKPPELGGGGTKVTQKPSSQVGGGDPGISDTSEPVDDFDGAITTDRNDEVYTFLLVGRDHESNSTDTIIIGKLDAKNHTIDCVNIPRDTLINIGWSTTPKKINAVYPGYVNSGESGVEGLKKYIKNLVGFDIDCYAVVNLAVVEDVINELGGVYFDVPINMNYDDGKQHFHVHLDAGYQLLNGYEALGVFRYRHSNDGGGYPGGDIQRIGVQQDLMKSIASQLLTLGNIPNLTTIIQLLVDNVETDLSASNMAFFARQFLQCSSESISFHTAPLASTPLINNVSFAALSINDWLDMVNTYLSPFTEQITAANVNVLTCDATGTSFQSTTGAIAGGIDSFWDPVGGYAHAPGAAQVQQAEETPDPSEEPSEEIPEATETPALIEQPYTDPSAGSVSPEETPQITEVLVPAA